ncbi:uncharacterized protein LOC142175817 [Nicotiana tabacum]|uniref:Uncharacterized protein LOC142175817 n=1 Tax=Nicotiana tabacum TaxID=4097 RepID=A0AC58TNV8_TOBAC
MGELETSRGSNQELGFVRAGDTRWGSYDKSLENFTLLFYSIIDVLDTLVADASTLDGRAKKKEQDIANAIIFVEVAKKKASRVKNWFSNLGGLGKFSKTLVETKKNITFPLVFCLLKLALLLSIATAMLKKLFSQ